MGGTVSGMFLVAVLGVTAVCAGLLTVRLFRPAGQPASPAVPGDPGQDPRG